jgi:hypothetical protein
MPTLPIHPVPASDLPGDGLEQEVLRLEAELQQAEATLNAFEQTVRTQLGEQIRQMRVLTDLYKAQKAAKKDKRREQKRRGKNYQAPQGLLKSAREEEELESDDPAELKRLYREAIVQVHPDKFPEASEAEGRQAAALTTHLNALYERGDVEALRDFHEHILGEHPLRHTAYVAGNATHNFLLRKKEQLAVALEELLQSQSYQLAITPDRGELVDALREQFAQRIVQLKKRTRQ